MGSASLSPYAGLLMTCTHGHLQEFDSSVPPFSMRKLLSNTNGKLLDAILRHRHFVLRAENSVIRKLLKPLNAAEKQIRGEIANIAALGGGVSDFSRMRLAQLQQMEAVIGRAMAQVQERTAGVAVRQMELFALSEFEIQDSLLRRIIPKGISLELGHGSPARALQIISEPLGGRFWADRMDDDFRALELQWRQDLATSFALGEGMEQAAARMDRATDTIGRQRLTAIARTEMQRVANRAAMGQYEQNRDVIKLVQILETLDNRTCLICAVLDGQTRRVGSGDIPPFHTSCRGFIVPVTRSLEEMGLNPDDFPPSVQAVLDGKPSDRVVYSDWFDGQSDNFQLNALGPTRFERFKSGALEINDFVDTKDLRILSVGELPLMSLQP